MSAVDTYSCPVDGCDYEIFAVGLQDPDEPDYFTEDIEQHKRGHAEERQHVELGDDGTESEAIAEVQVPHPGEIDMGPLVRSSSQAGLATLVPSGGAVTQPNPAPSDAPTCTCHPVPERYHTTHYGATEPGSTLEPDYDCPVHFPASTHVLDRIPGEPNPLDLDPAVGFTAAIDVDSGVTWHERPTVWITAEQYAALGEPQQVTVTIGAVR